MGVTRDEPPAVRDEQRPAAPSRPTAPPQRDDQTHTPGHADHDARAPGSGEPSGEERARVARPRGLRVLPVLITLIALAIAALLGWAVWNAYIVAPWTRDATVNAYVVTEASEVAGRLVELPVRADGFVRKGEVLMQIDPTNYQIAVADSEAAVEQAQATLDNARNQNLRRQQLTTLSTSIEEKQTYLTTERTAEATLHSDLANLAQARVNLQRTRIVSPVNGYVTNLQAQVGDYVTVGERVISIVNSDSFWVDGYFEETQLAGIRVGDVVKILLMGYNTPIWGHVDGIARGINVPNAEPDGVGLASVNPTFTWIRLAQRIPVRIALDPVPPGIALVVGMTATVQINPSTGHGPDVLHALLPWAPPAAPPGAAPAGMTGPQQEPPAPPPAAAPRLPMPAPLPPPH